MRLYPLFLMLTNVRTIGYMDDVMPRRGPVPLYYQILQILRMRIASGDYAVGSQLPTDEDLMQEFGVSRHTVRSALQQLVSEGAVERFPGKGSFVRERAVPANQWTIDSIEDLIDVSFKHKFKVIAARFISARSRPKTAELFGLAPSDSLFEVRGLRSSDAGSYAYSKIYFPPEIGQKLPRDLFESRPLTLLVEEYCGVPAFQTRQVTSAAPADREAAHLLKVRFGDPLLVLERTFFSQDGRPIEYTRIHYRPDRYQQVVNFYRRQELPYLPSQALYWQSLQDDADTSRSASGS